MKICHIFTLTVDLEIHKNPTLPRGGCSISESADFLPSTLKLNHFPLGKVRFSWRYTRRTLVLLVNIVKSVVGIFDIYCQSKDKADSLIVYKPNWNPRPREKKLNSLNLLYHCIVQPKMKVLRSLNNTSYLETGALCRSLDFLWFFWHFAKQHASTFNFVAAGKRCKRSPETVQILHFRHSVRPTSMHKRIKQRSGC